MRQYSGVQKACIIVACSLKITSNSPCDRVIASAISRALLWLCEQLGQDIVNFRLEKARKVSWNLSSKVWPLEGFVRGAQTAQFTRTPLWNPSSLSASPPALQRVSASLMAQAP